MQVQGLPVPRSETPQWMSRKVLKASSFRSFKGIPTWCRKPQALTYRLCAEIITRSGISHHFLKKRGARDRVLPRASCAKGRSCVMCLVRVGGPRLLPCCLCESWCHVTCSYQTHLGSACPCHIRILDPKRKIMLLSHPYLEDNVMFPTREGVRLAVNQHHHEIDYKAGLQDVTISRWRAAWWINVRGIRLSWTTILSCH